MPHVKGWREQLTRLVAAAGCEDYPLCVYDVRSPSGKSWPAKWPANSAIRDFYSICDGGTLSLQYTFLTLLEVGTETLRYRSELPKLAAEGQDWRLTDQMLVLGEDSGGALLIWDGTEDTLSTLYWRGGDWEPLGYSFEGFMQTLFTDPAKVHAEDLWMESLVQLDKQA